jgi:type III restriction enzyme
VPKPLGSYNPNWAILMEKDGTQRLYFMIESKSSLFVDDLRDRESVKIICGEAHFKELERGDYPAKLVKATTLEDVLVRT